MDKDETPEYRRIHVVPFRDTLPRAYEFNIFRDYLKPYFQQNFHLKYRKEDRFTFQGVQFKVSRMFVCGYDLCTLSGLGYIIYDSA